MAEASSGGAPAMGNLPTAVEGPREAPLVMYRCRRQRKSEVSGGVFYRG
jgi:hypothetical protein